MFIVVVIYGWVCWCNFDGGCVIFWWVLMSVCIGFVLVMIVGMIVLILLFWVFGLWEFVWVDVWIFVGLFFVIYGMVKGWIEFWLIWIVVDVVGVLLLFSLGYYVMGFMYVFYGGFIVIGFVIWWWV